MLIIVMKLDFKSLLNPYDINIQSYYRISTIYYTRYQSIQSLPRSMEQHHSEDLNINTGTKLEKYESVLPQILSLVSHQQRLVTNAANIVAALKEQFNWWWVGFYFVEQHKDQLYLGPFQGPVACTRIKKGKGVCGTSWQQKKTIIVEDVDKFPGHIACSIPLMQGDKCFGVLDVDSEHLNHFDEVDKKWLQKLVEELAVGKIFNM